MDFYEVLDQILDLLKQRGRVSYPALKVQFNLDDDHLEAIRAELIEAQQLASDENGRVLVWIGETERAPGSASQLDPTMEQPAAQEEPSPQVEPPPVEPHTLEAERRQLTVMFCDLVDSTKLSSQLDPEDYREVVREYQQVCSEVIQRYDGHIAQLLGDGLLVYFGYPVAHEEDAQRAIHTGLGIIEAIGVLNIRLEQTKSIRLALRLGIHTGLVVVGEMGGVGRQELLALGETPNIAARIQGLAAPDSVVISDATYRLVQGYFEFQELGEQHLRGVTQPIQVYRVLQESGVQSRLDVASTRGLTPLVGREQEVGLLLERWQRAKTGQGQVILLSGEAGIGKSRLVQVLKDHLAEEPYTRWECRSLPYYQNTALYPLIDLLQRALQWHQDDSPEQRLKKLEQNLRQYRLPLDESAPLFGALLALPVPEDRYPSLNLAPQRQRQRTLEVLIAIIVELSEQQPMLFILEDLHWTDPTTLELLELLIDQTPTASLYLLATCRPEYQPSWSHRSYLTEITVNRLSRNQIKQMATRVAGGKTLPVEIIEQLVDKTDGVPLYVEEMTKVVLESGTLKEVNGQYELVGSVSSLAIPATLQDSLMARLDRLVTAKAVAQYAAVIGRQFSYALLREVSQLDEAMLQHELGRLVDAELVYQRGLPPQATYLFKHALVVTTAYESLLKSTRQHYHQRIAQTLEERFPETAETQPELLAHHYTEAGRTEQAITYWQRAGQRASERSAYQEAISHLTTGLSLLQTLPETLERHQQELPLQTALGTASVILRGHGAPEVETAYTRARILCQQLGDTQDVFPVLLGLCRFYAVRTDFSLARQLGEDLLALAKRRDELSLYLMAHYALGTPCLWMGELLLAHSHLEESIARDTPAQRRSSLFRVGQDPGVASRIFIAYTLWLLGYPDQALARAHDALALATKLAHPFNDAFALLCASLIGQLRGEGEEVYDRAEAAVTLSTEQGFTLWLSGSIILRGWALTVRGQREAGLRQIHRGLADWRASGAELTLPYFLALLAEGYGTLNQAKAGLDALKEAWEVIERTGERWSEAELHRLKGQLLLQQSPDNATETESCFHQAIAIAQNQSAKSWELRATSSLARLWQSQGKRDQARELLEPVYSWFTEGFDTADLIDAKTLLDELS
jgi:class 3 adenylate cyclase/predicted ATPase